MAEAKFKIGVEGADRSEQELRRVKEAFGGIDKASSSLKGAGENLLRLGASAARAANDMHTINIAAAADKFKAIDDSLTRMAIRGGKSVSELKTKFSELGIATGTSSDRLIANVRQFDRMTFSGLDDAMTSMKALGIAAEDADMSIEEMAGLGADLYQKLGVPAAKIGDELKRIKAMATDASIPGGLGAMVGILGKLTAAGGNRVQGGSARLGAMVTALREQGMNPEMATEQAGKMIQMVNGLPMHLVTRALRGVYGKKYNPIVRDAASGREVLRDDVYPGLQKAFKQSPNEMGALLSQTGFGIEGVELAHTIKNMDWDRVRQIQRLPDTLKAGGAVPIEAFAKSGGQASMFAAELYDRARGKVPDESSVFSHTAAGERIRTDQEKAAAAVRIGASIQGHRDRRNAFDKGRHTSEAVADSAVTGLISILPAKWQAVAAPAREMANLALGSTPGQLISAPSSYSPADQAQQTAALAKAAAAMTEAAATMKGLPRATADSVRSLQRTSPLGAASEAAKPPSP